MQEIYAYLRHSSINRDFFKSHKIGTGIQQWRLLVLLPLHSLKAFISSLLGRRAALSLLQESLIHINWIISVT